MSFLLCSFQIIFSTKLQQGFLISVVVLDSCNVRLSQTKSETVYI